MNKNYIKNYNINKKTALSFLKNYEVDLNIYIDAFHLFLFIDQSINNAQKQYEDFFNFYKLKNCPALYRNKEVYSILLLSLFKSFKRELEDRIQKENLSANKKIKIATDREFIHSGLHRKILNENEIKLIFEKIISIHSNTALELTKYLQINTYIHFFAGGDIDKNYLLRFLTNLLRNSSDPIRIQQISKHINYFKTNDVDKYSDRQLKEIHKFNIFKDAMKNFNNMAHDLASEMIFGKTKFQIPETKTFFIKFSEKAVDSSLIISVMKELNSSNNSVFSVITNDTDYLPLFKEIKSIRKLYWMHGNKNPSKELSDIVDSSNQFNLHQFFEKEFFSMGNQIWLKQLLEAVDYKYDIEEMILHYRDKILDDEWKIIQKKHFDDWDREMRREMELLDDKT